ELDEGERQQAQAKPGGDAEGERGGDNGEEGGEGFGEIVPANAGHRTTHQGTNKNQRRSGSVCGNGGDQRGAKHGDEEKSGDHHVAKASARAGGDSGGAVDVAGYGGGAWT